jgi:hypothetical protein
MAVGAREASISRDAKIVSMTALMLISPRPTVTGSSNTKNRRTAGSRQSMTSLSRPSSPRSQGTGRNSWISVPTTIEAA